MTWRWRTVPKSFKANNDRRAQAAGTRADPGKPRRARIPSRSARTRSGRNRNRPPNLVWRARGQIQLADISHIGCDGMRAFGSLFIAPSRQFGEALFLEDRGDRRRAERVALAGQGATDVVNGEVLLAEGDHVFAQPFLLARRSAYACRRDDEVARGLSAELLDKDAKASRCVAEPPGRFGGGDTVDEEGPEGFVLSVGGVGGLQEPACQC